MLFKEAGKCYVKPEACHQEFQFLLNYTKMLEGVFSFFSPNYQFWLYVFDQKSMAAVNSNDNLNSNLEET